METLNTILNIITLVSIIGSGAWFLFSYKAKIDKAVEGYGKINELDTGIKCIETYIKDLSNFFHVKDVADKLVPNNLKDFRKYYQANSPLRLTDFGVELIKDTGFISILENKKDYILEDIKQKLDDKKDSEAFFYFAEKYSIDTIKKYYDAEDNILDPVRKYIFSTGKSDEKQMILKALGLYLRDIIIEEYGKKAEFIELCEKEKAERLEKEKSQSKESK